jgi:O-antigen/teichoic acid export membrane protein
MSSTNQQTRPQRGAGAPAGANSLDEAKAGIPRNVLFNWLNYGILILITFLITPLVVHGLGNTAYGVWGLIGQLLGYSSLLDFGVRIAVTRYVARHLALAQAREINKVLTTSLVFSCFSAALALGGGVVGAYLLPRLFAIPAELLLQAQLSCIVVAAGIAVTFPGSVFHGCVTATSRYDLLSIRNISTNVTRALLLWFFLRRGYGLLAVATISTGTLYLGYGLDFLLARRLLPYVRLRREFFDVVTLRSLVTFSVYVFVLSVSWRLIFMTDNVVVGFVLGPVAVAFYTVGLQVADMLRDSLSNITALYAPLASQMDALKQKDSLRRLFLGGARLGLLYVLAGVVGLTVLGPRFLGFWLGESFADRSGPILVLLATETAFYAVALTCGQVLYGMNRHKVNAWLSLGNATANFVLSTILIRWWGAVGVAWGTLVPAFIVEAIVLPVYTASVLHISPLRFYKSVVMRPLAAAAPYGLWLWFWRAQGLVQGYGSLALVIAAGLVLYAPLAWKLGLDNDDRIFVRNMLAGLKSRGRRTQPAGEATRGESSTAPRQNSD